MTKTKKFLLKLIWSLNPNKKELTIFQRRILYFMADGSIITPYREE